MKVLIYEGPKVLTIRNQPIPVPEEDEVLIRVERVGICGSELSGYLGHNSLRKPPLIMGHEFSGTIVQKGAKVSRFNAGDRVTVNPLITCGICRDCITGSSQICRHRKLLGAHLPGAFAEYVTVVEKNVYLLKDSVSFDSGALTEPFACAVHVCRLLQLTPTDRLLIVGAGPIGLFTLLAAQVYGLKNIAVIDINEQRLEIASQLGAVTAVQLDILLQQGSGVFDAAVDAVGLEITRMQCIDNVKPGGRVIFTGLHEDTSNFQVNSLIRNEIAMKGAFAYNAVDFETALQWIEEGRVNLFPWLAHAPLEDGQQCFDRLITGPGNVAKFLLTFS
ncbi:alcohol dehydrogenase catalytic domain-containing protein [Paenibacillus sp. LMG 31456]|uniref:Alcohol dehydrogenase catalytic domain-containing protein n=1 Tax=Paenibacillus foliorum TaxID=2654974 RepID=A0A972K1B8_9BACL|nr:alcohol dehydrogenase catalytic domain-containing protein [Paenibacillus foliorum]NOU95541.1 alcohol dehydrogenase catalytic domain-containing protein [Paenibacillus foliorum]